MFENQATALAGRSAVGHVTVTVTIPSSAEVRVFTVQGLHWS